MWAKTRAESRLQTLPVSTLNGNHCRTPLDVTGMERSPPIFPELQVRTTSPGTTRYTQVGQTGPSKPISRLLLQLDPADMSLRFHSQLLVLLKISSPFFYSRTHQTSPPTPYLVRAVSLTMPALSGRQPPLPHRARAATPAEPRWYPNTRAGPYRFRRLSIPLQGRR